MQLCEGVLGSVKKVFPKNFAIFTRKHPETLFKESCRSRGLQVSYKHLDLWHRCFLRNFAKYFKYLILEDRHFKKFCN